MKNVSGQSCVMVSHKILISEKVLHTQGVGVLHREAQKNLDRQALLAVPSQSISTSSGPSVQSQFYMAVHASSNLCRKMHTSLWVFASSL
jgi:hypothetical protein